MSKLLLYEPLFIIASLFEEEAKRRFWNPVISKLITATRGINSPCVAAGHWEHYALHALRTRILTLAQSFFISCMGLGFIL
jgi:hypothetical protein